MTFDPASLKYNDKGLIPAITQDDRTGEILMMAWMNAEAVAKTLASGRVTYWSRSRQELWVKGETSGNTQALVDFRIDCDRCWLFARKDRHAIRGGKAASTPRSVRTRKWSSWHLRWRQLDPPTPQQLAAGPQCLQRPTRSRMSDGVAPASR